VGRTLEARGRGVVECGREAAGRLEAQAPRHERRPVRVLAQVLDALELWGVPVGCGRGGAFR
jgi:hypothetical protein